MYYDKQKVIDWAYAQVGYHEGENNWNKYAEVLDKVKGFYNGIKQNQMWCDVWVDCGFYECYSRAGAQYLLCQPDASAGAGCAFSAQYFNSAGCFRKSGPETGDQIFFGSAWNNIWHTGLVVAVSENYVTTIEGNTSDQVAKRVYKLSDPNIWGYGRPRWGTPDSGSDTSTGSDAAAPETPQKPAEEPAKHMYNVKLPLLTIGDKGPYVVAVQTLLIARGYDCGNKPLIGVEKPDGDFGRATERAVGFFQSKCELPDIDGEVGGDTWSALLSKWG